MVPMKKLLILFILALAACSGEARPSREMADMMEPAASAPAAAHPERALAIGRAPDAATGGQPASTPTIAPAMLIRTGEASVLVDSVEAAMARVQRMARELGGYVGNTSISGGEQEIRSAVLELKVPAARFDQAVGGLRPVGKVESVKVQAQDVGEEFVDVTARMTNAKRLEERLLGLLATRTGKLEDVLAVERELARVRQEIEVHEGRLRFLRTRAAVSTLTVTLHEAYPVVGAYPGSNPIAEAFRDAWRNFVGFMAGLIASLGFLIPLGLILAGIVWLIRRFWRPRPPRAPKPPPASGP